MAKSPYTSFDSFSLREIESEAELIPLMTAEDEEALNKEALPSSIPISELSNKASKPTNAKTANAT